MNADFKNALFGAVGFFLIVVVCVALKYFDIL